MGGVCCAAKEDFPFDLEEADDGVRNLALLRHDERVAALEHLVSEMTEDQLKATYNTIPEGSNVSSPMPSNLTVAPKDQTSRPCTMPSPRF